MKIKFLAVEIAPDEYIIEGEKITVKHNGELEEFDLSVMEQGDLFCEIDVENENIIHGCQPDVIGLIGQNIIGDAQRDEHGELYVVLCQTAPEGEHWRESDWVDAKDYEPGKIYIKQISEEEAFEEFGGLLPWA